MKNVLKSSLAIALNQTLSERNKEVKVVKQHSWHFHFIVKNGYSSYIHINMYADGSMSKQNGYSHFALTGQDKDDVVSVIKKHANKFDALPKLLLKCLILTHK